MDRTPFRLLQACLVFSIPATLVLARPAESDAAEPAAELTVEARGLRVVGAPYEGRQDMRPFNDFTGTTVALLVRHPAGGLIAFDDETSEVSVFRDSSGKDLLVEGDYTQPGFRGFPSVCEDGRAALVEIVGGAQPSAGKLTLAGKMVFDAAQSQATHKAERVALRAGTELRLGPIAFTITEVGKPNWGDEPLAITLKAEQDLTELAAVRFLDAQGQPIEAHEGGTTRMGFGGMVQVHKEYRLTREVETATVEIDRWTDLRKVTQTFSLELDVGL